MTDKEKIRQEILRRVEETPSTEGVIALESLLDYINSISEESTSEDLEEYYTKEFLPKEWFAKPGHRTISQFNFFTAHHFAEWQKQQMMKDAVELHIVESFNPVGTENEKPHGFTALCYNAEYPDFYTVAGQTIKVIPIKEAQQ